MTFTIGQKLVVSVVLVGLVLLVSLFSWWLGVLSVFVVAPLGFKLLTA